MIRSRSLIPVSVLEAWLRSDRLEVLDEISLLRRGQVQVEGLVVVLHHGEQVREASVVVEAALLMRPETGQRTGSVHVRGRSVGLEVVDADLTSGVHVESGLGEEWWHVARGALRR